jgi:hypothetical protein
MILWGGAQQNKIASCRINFNLYPLAVLVGVVISVAYVFGGK